MLKLALLLLVWPLAADELPRHVLELSRVRRNMKRAIETLPSFTCLAVVERSRGSYVDGKPRPMQSQDTVRLEVAHAEDRDWYAWPGSASFEFKEPRDFLLSGAFSSGEFYTHLASVFSQQAVLKYAGEATVLGANLMRWDFDLAAGIGTNWMVGWDRQKAVAGAKGSIWANPMTHDVVRLEAVSTGLPPDFPITEVRVAIGYARVRIGGTAPLLPQWSTMTLDELAGGRAGNHTEYSHCRQYQTTSGIRFDVADTAEPSATAPQGITEIVLPAGLAVQLALDETVPMTLAVGDAVRAVVAADVADKKQVLVPKGATVVGRVRQMERDGDPRHAEAYLVGLEFTDLEFAGHHARFLAKMQGARPAGTVHVPGVAQFEVNRPPFELPKGMAMTWITEDVRRQ